MTAWQAPALRGKGPGPQMWPGSDHGAVDCPAAEPTRPVARARTAATPGLEPISLPLEAAIVTSTGGHARPGTSGQVVTPRPGAYRLHPTAVTALSRRRSLQDGLGHASCAVPGCCQGVAGRGHRRSWMPSMTGPGDPAAERWSPGTRRM